MPAQVQLKLALNRLKLVRQKKAAAGQTARREIAALIEKGKMESARVRVENVIRDDYYCEALELVELYVDTLLARFSVLETIKECDVSVRPAVNALFYVAGRIEVPELVVVRDQLAFKFGREFAMVAAGDVDERMLSKLSPLPPPPSLVDEYVRAIAETFHLELPEEPQKEPIGNEIFYQMIHQGIPPQFPQIPQQIHVGIPQQIQQVIPQQFPQQIQQVIPQQIQIPILNPSAPIQPPTAATAPPAFPTAATAPPAFPTTPQTIQEMNIPIQQTTPQTNQQTSHENKDDSSAPDFDQLAKRFEALKRKK